MKKILKIHFYIGLILLFCGFCLSSLPKSFSKTKARAFDISPTEIELKEYQQFEHGIPTTAIPEFESQETHTDKSPGNTYTVVIDAGHGGPDPGSIGYKTKVYESNLNLKLSKIIRH